MKRTNAQIYQTELLLTLDYLLNYTDKDHPATQQDICKHATDFGLKYDPKATNGNDVRRQRVGECLQFLQYICYKFEDTGKIPFVIETTEAGKFYVEEKNHLNNEEIIKILAAVKNDKYTKDDDASILIEKLLDLFSNCYNRNYFKEQLELSNKAVNRYTNSANRKIWLVSKAFKQGKMIKIRWEIYDRNGKDIHVYDLWYRVYKIQEFNSRLYAILLPVSTGQFIFYQGIIFDQIQNLNIPNGRESEILLQDFDEHRDLNKLFAKTNKSDFKLYGDIDKMLEANKRPEGGKASVFSFYFHLGVQKFVEKSFKEFFSRPLDFIKCASFDVLEEKPKEETVDSLMETNKGLLIPHKLKNGERPEYGLVNVSLNIRAFKSWVLSDPHEEGFINIGDMITIVGSRFIKESLAYYYYKHLMKNKDYLKDNAKKDLLNEFQDKKQS